MRSLILAAALSLTAAPALAACSEQLIRSVENMLPDLRAPVEVRDLSCNGVSQLFFLLTTDSGDKTRFEIRQNALAVFRNEGLIR